VASIALKELSDSVGPSASPGPKTPFQTPSFGARLVPSFTTEGLPGVCLNVWTETDRSLTGALQGVSPLADEKIPVVNIRKPGWPELEYDLLLARVQFHREVTADTPEEF